MKEKSDELIEVTNRLNDEIEAKDSKIGGLEKQLVNVTNELEDVRAYVSPLLAPGRITARFCQLAHSMLANKTACRPREH